MITGHVFASITAIWVCIQQITGICDINYCSLCVHKFKIYSGIDI